MHMTQPVCPALMPHASLHTTAPFRNSRPACSHRRQRAHLTPRAAQATSGAAVADRPKWSGGGPVSALVNWLIGIKPLFQIMRVRAYREMWKTADERGIPWREHVDELQGQMALLEELKSELEDRSIEYPDYYLVPFHAYETGNLEWQAAMEVAPVSKVIAMRTWKAEPTLHPDIAEQRLRGSITDAIQAFQRQHGVPTPQDILDIGCSVGVSTRWLADVFPASSIVGLDLSPYMLAVAEYTERKVAASSSRQRIKYVHALAEDSKLPSASQDLVSLQFIFHECPDAATTAIVKEARRLLRPGGVLAMADNNPKSETIQNLSPVIATLMKSTEPHSDEYYCFDTEECMRQQGFVNVVTVATDHRHRAVLGMLPDGT